MQNHTELQIWDTVSDTDEKLLDIQIFKSVMSFEAFLKWRKTVREMNKPSC